MNSSCPDVFSKLLTHMQVAVFCFGILESVFPRRSYLSGMAFCLRHALYKRLYEVLLLSFPHTFIPVVDFVRAASRNTSNLSPSHLLQGKSLIFHIKKQSNGVGTTQSFISPNELQEDRLA
jgi:hypothetical protein